MSRVQTTAIAPSNGNTPARGPMPSDALAATLNVDKSVLLGVIRKTIMPHATDEELAAFCMVAAKYKLNPITREIFAFPKKGGGIQPVVSVDGWISIVNSQPIAGGPEWEFQYDDNGDLFSCTCSIWIKGRERPVVVTEFLSECYRGTEPWKMRHRMLKHKAYKECARYAFGLGGIVDEDEAKDIIATEGGVEQPAPRRSASAINETLQAKVLPEPTATPFTPRVTTRSQQATVVRAPALAPDAVRRQKPETAPEPEVIEATANNDTFTDDDVPFGNTGPGSDEPADHDSAEVASASPGSVAPESLPPKCDINDFVTWAGMFAPSDFDPDEAQAAIFTHLRVGVSVPWERMKDAQRDALYQAFRNGTFKWKKPN